MYDFNNEINNALSGLINVFKSYSRALNELRVDLFKLELRVKELEAKVNGREDDHT